MTICQSQFILLHGFIIDSKPQFKLDSKRAKISFKVSSIHAFLAYFECSNGAEDSKFKKSFQTCPFSENWDESVVLKLIDLKGENIQNISITSQKW